MELVGRECSSTLGAFLANALIYDLKPFFKKMSTLTILCFIL